ncbi:MAG TPA: GntR family transcriptional regulator [Bryobacteraceae bacterium]|nr:GntR family transcriptional regulator [Bryobacteraceae bacterium]
MNRRKFTAEPHVPKYQQVFENLSRDILSGRYAPGQKFPSEAALVQQFRTSRITIGRALRELSQRGLVERVAGSGTYVGRVHVSEGSLLFGLLIPDLGRTEIFEPICQGIAAAPQASRHALLWGHAAPGQSSPGEQALGLCDQFVKRNVAGVFFAPIETGAKARETNLTIVSRLEKARIPIVLLDRCVMPYPGRSRHDLVGIDNRRAAYLATEHLLSLGPHRISFLACSGGAPTIEARIAGFREALLANGIPLERGPVHRVDEVTEASIRPLLKHRRQGDSFVCANDRTAGELMRVLLASGYRIPLDVRIAGIDDVEYASLLPVPLTTVRQPCREIGEAAMEAMLSRIERPDRLARDILVECRLVVRDSCGARTAAP